MYGDTFRCPELRHEVTLGVPDPFLYAEVGGVRHVVIGAMEIARMSELSLDRLHPYEEFGSDDLIAAGKTYADLRREIPVRAVKALGVTRAVVPDGFPVWLADSLRAEGIEITADDELFDERRRVKTPAELAGIRRAQRAAEAGMDAARDLLRRSTPNGDALTVDGAPLTVERIKTAMAQAFAANGTSADDFIVAPGPQGAVGHDMGSGPVRAGVPIVIDVWPRDNETACFADMTRTFVVGEVPEDVSAMALALQGGARHGRRGDPRRRTGPRRLRPDVRHLRGGGRADPADEGAREDAVRRLLPRPRARRRPRGARAARHGARVEGARCAPATSSRWSRGSTGRDTAASGSRTSCS